MIAEGFLEKENLKGEYHVVSPGQSVIKEIASGNIDVGQEAVSHSWSELEKGNKPSVAQFVRANLINKRYSYEDVVVPPPGS